MIESGGNPNLLIGQIVAVFITIVFAAAGSFILLKGIDAIIGIRVRLESEQRGLDVSEHGEEGYMLA